MKAQACRFLVPDKSHEELLECSIDLICMDVYKLFKIMGFPVFGFFSLVFPYVPLFPTRHLPIFSQFSQGFRYFIIFPYISPTFSLEWDPSPTFGATTCCFSDPSKPGCQSCGGWSKAWNGEMGYPQMAGL